MNDEELGMALLSPLRAEGLGPSRVDLDEAVRVGGRRRRTRQLLTGAGALAVTALLLVSGTLVTRSMLEAPMVTPADAGRFNPAERQLTVPDAAGFAVQTIELAEHYQKTTLQRSAPQGQASDPNQPSGVATVAIWAPGDLPRQDGVTWSTVGAQPADVWSLLGGSAQAGAQLPEAAAGDPAPPMPIYWIDTCPSTRPPCASAGLMWERSAGSWGSVWVDLFGGERGPAQPTVADAQLAAANLFAASSTDRQEPTRVPLVTPTPPGQHLVGVGLSQNIGGDPYDTVLHYSDADWWSASPDDRSVAIALTRDPGPTTNTTVAGHPAYLSPADNNVLRVVLPYVAGEWTLSAWAPAGDPFATAADFANFLLDVRVCASPSDRRSWFTLPR